MKKKVTNNFSKFVPKKSNAAIKEQFKQEKRKWKKEREEFFDKKRNQSGVGSQEPGVNIGNRQHATSNQQPVTSNQQPATGNQQMPLNKFIAHAGICGRREAAELVKKGLVKVNAETITEPGFKVSSKDEVKVNGRKIFPAKNLVYILLNKPKDYITTTDDPQGRKTVLDLISRATTERVYPVGRLDRNTSGVLLLTNDGELAQKLTHPSNEIKKVYHVTLNKALDKKDYDQILKGVVLEDGPATVDALAYADIKDKTQIGVEIHSGRNRIVRRIFEHLKYDVKNLDRVIFAGLTKKNIERGKWRSLSEKEVRDLKHFGKGK
ncbi:MAG TPA: pseudouridine synthase [Chitinophagaceae bacterium]|nr:pseudouridine synthase [Chitinophagaceae bacterium]